MIEIILPVQGIEGDVEIVESSGPDGKKCPVAIRIRPRYYTAKAVVPVAHLQTTNSKGEILHRTILRQSGQTGKVSLSDQTEAVEPVFDRPELSTKESRPDGKSSGKPN